jgi:hypothetical protein
MNGRDAGKNCADAVNLAVLLGGTNRWIAVRLSDGKTDGSIYDTKSDAIRHQLHEYQCAYVKVPLDGMSIDHGERFLEVNRKLYDNGMRIADPDHAPIMPNTIEEYNVFMKGK